MDTFRIISDISDAEKALGPRIEEWDRKADTLSKVAHTFEERTTATQTDGECARLDLLIGEANAASNHLEDLKTRQELLAQAISILEDEEDLAEREGEILVLVR